MVKDASSSSIKKKRKATNAEADSEIDIYKVKCCLNTKIRFKCHLFSESYRIRG